MPGCSYSPVSDQAIRLRRPALGLYQLAIHQTLGDLHRVECGAFAQVVRTTSAGRFRSLHRLGYG
jgi:hypothetical protein